MMRCNMFLRQLYVAIFLRQLYVAACLPSWDFEVEDAMARLALLRAHEADCAAKLTAATARVCR
jgi:hypothetical protein